MGSWHPFAGSTLVIAATIFLALEARAQTPAADQSEFSGGVRFASRPLNLGFGLRGGYRLANGLYFGAALDYFLGQHRVRELAGVRSRSNTSFWLGQAEVGYEIALARRLGLMPWLGAGVGWTRGQRCQTAASTSTCATTAQSKPAVELGVLAAYAFGPLRVLPEIRWLMMPEMAIVGGASIGFIF